MPQALAETITHSPRESGDALAIRADALRAEAWAGEPFLRPDEDPDVVLAPGTARRRALDDALAELAAGRDAPSTEWKVRYALLLGLERVLSEKPPHLASGTELRRHQVDALAGMLTELIAAAQKGENGNGHDEPEDDDEADDDLELELEVEAESEPRTTSSRCRSRPTRARSAATASAIRPRPARRSPPPASSRLRAPKAS